MWLSDHHRIVNSSVTSRSYTLVTLKKLFAMSYNVCAMPWCEEQLSRPEWGSVLAEIAHIHGVAIDGPRYQPGITADELNSYDNLLLLCRNCHRKVDYLEVDRYPADRLIEIKREHEERAASGRPMNSEELDSAVVKLVLALGLFIPGSVDQEGRPMDVIEQLSSFVDEAQGIAVTPMTGNLYIVVPDWQARVRAFLVDRFVDSEVVSEFDRRGAAVEGMKEDSMLQGRIAEQAAWLNGLNRAIDHWEVRRAPDA